MKYLTLIAVAFVSYGAVADELDILANSETLSEDLMHQSRGGNYELNIENIQAESDMYGDVAGNAAYNNTNGGNYINSGSFNDASGVINVVQNTGHNVLIQSSTVINMKYK